MNISPIPGSPSNSDPVAPQPSVGSSSHHHQPAPLPSSGTQYPQDIVQLSQVVQIQQLAQSGESVSLIASSTGLSVSAVDLDLGITTTPSNVSVAAQGSQGGGQGIAAPVQAVAPTTGASATPDSALTSTPTIPVG